MFPLDASSIDKSLPVPVGTQLYGLLSYSLGFGGIASGARLQSVRALATQLGIAPMTVSQVYQKLRDEGLIEMRRGRGAYVATTGRYATRSLPPRALRGDIDRLLSKAERLGVSNATLVSMLNVQSQLRGPHTGLNVVFVGIFEAPTRDYVQQIKEVLSGADRITVVLLDGLKASAEAQEICTRADVVLTFLQREAEVRQVIPAANIFALSFIPSENTRRALAGLDPRTRVAAVTYFSDYIAIMRPSVLQFAPHVGDIAATWLDAPEMLAVLEECDVVIFASGADRVMDHVRPGVPCIEFRHAPDPSVLEADLAPYLSDFRRRRAASAEAGLLAPAPGATKRGTRAQAPMPPTTTLEGTT